eukprot:Hpha_TRINITY_DN27947_c0_g1::TRINITY_DN27947_c0_g1_i1::g.45052::m.45052
MGDDVTARQLEFSSDSLLATPLRDQLLSDLRQARPHHTLSLPTTSPLSLASLPAEQMPVSRLMRRLRKGFELECARSLQEVRGVVRQGRRLPAGAEHSEQHYVWLELLNSTANRSGIAASLSTTPEGAAVLESLWDVVNRGKGGPTAFPEHLVEAAVGGREGWEEVKGRHFDALQ